MVVRVDELRAKLMRWLLPITVVLVVACADGQAATGSSAAAAPPTVDSIVDPRTALATFVEGLPRPVQLAGGAPGPDKLIEQLFDALSRSDSASISDMVITRAEYGFFYYPTSAYAGKPYQLPPQIAWMLSSEASAKGARRLLARLGGRELTVERHECGRVEREGGNEVRSDCTVTYSDESGARATRSLFRSVIIRDGRAKFLSYAGDF
jgi:hypothetical protein